MSRQPGIRYFHVLYDPAPGSAEHDLKNGPECWCEPKSFRASATTVVVIHDPEDGLIVIEDANGRSSHYPDNPYGPGTPGGPSDPPRDPKRG